MVDGTNQRQIFTKVAQYEVHVTSVLKTRPNIDCIPKVDESRGETFISMTIQNTGYNHLVTQLLCSILHHMPYHTQLPNPGMNSNLSFLIQSVILFIYFLKSAVNISLLSLYKVVCDAR